MLEYLKDAGITPNRPLTKRSKTDLILLHASDRDDDTVKGMDEKHQSNGNRMIEYNFVVYANGEVWNGRGLEYEGGSVSNSIARTKGLNARAVAICCVGNFNDHGMPKAQFEALKRLVVDIVNHYNMGSSSQIISHIEAAGSGNTDCPGMNFPTDEIRAYVRGYGPSNEPDLPIVEPAGPPVYEVMAGTLNFREAPDGTLIKQLHRGDLVKLDRYVEGENWARVYHNDQLGWVWLNNIGK